MNVRVCRDTSSRFADRRTFFLTTRTLSCADCIRLLNVRILNMLMLSRLDFYRL